MGIMTGDELQKVLAAALKSTMNPYLRIDQRDQFWSDRADELVMSLSGIIVFDDHKARNYLILSDRLKKD